MFDAPSFSRIEFPPSDNPQRWIIMYKRLSGWWFGTWLWFFHNFHDIYIYTCGIILPIDELIFFNMVIAPPCSNTVRIPHILGQDISSMGISGFTKMEVPIYIYIPYISIEVPSIYLNWRYLPYISIDFSLNSSPIAKWVENCPARKGSNFAKIWRCCSAPRPSNEPGWRLSR